MTSQIKKICMDFILGSKIVRPLGDGGYYVARREHYTEARTAVAQTDPKAQDAARASDRRYFKKHRHRRYRLRQALAGELPSSCWVLAHKVSRNARLRIPIPIEVPVKAMRRKYGASVPDTVLAELHNDIEQGMLTYNSNGEIEY